MNLSFYCFFFLCLIFRFYFPFSVVSQGYSSEPSNEYLISGNDALVQCKVPSYVADLTSVVGWVDNQGNQITGINPGK